MYNQVISLEFYQETHGDVSDYAIPIDLFASSSFDVNDFMRTLNNRQRIIVMLIYTGYKTHEISVILNKSISTIEKERMKIRHLIADYFGRSV